MIQHYINQLKKFNKLSHKEEVALAELIKKGDKKAENKLICANLLYVVSVASKYKGQGLSLDELICAGNLGVIEAAKRFDSKYDYKFITYARHWIKQQILRAIFELKYPYRTPLIYADDINKYKKSLIKLTKKLKREPNDDEMMNDLSIDIDKLNTIKLIEDSLKSVSIYDKVSNNKDYRYMDLIVDENSNIEDDYDYNNKINLLDKILKSLTFREKQVITLYYGLHNEPLTLKEISELFKISIEMVRITKEKAIDKIKKSKYKKELLEYIN